MPGNVVEVQNLSRRFGKMLALDDLSLQLQPGFVYGLVGANGAGKTTLIKHLLGLLRANQGSVRIFDKDPVRYPVEVLSRIGYLSEERDLPDWMQIHELLDYSSAYYAGWDRSYARELLNTFGLDPKKKIKHLSKGMRAQAGLIAAVAHHPDLLLLDEPSTGLDAVVRKDILNAVIRAVADKGQTTIFSSHLLDEVEYMSDYVFMINQGKLVLEGALDAIRERHHFLSVQFDSDMDSIAHIASVLSADQPMASSKRQWLAVCEGPADDVCQAFRSIGGHVTQSRSASLQEIFVARVGRSRQMEQAV